MLFLNPIISEVIVWGGNNYAGTTPYIPLTPRDQQKNQNYMYHGVFYTYYWFSLDESNKYALDVYFMVNGNIYNNNLPMQFVPSIGAYALSPLSPSTYLATSYQNAYQTAFEAEGNVTLNLYNTIDYNSLKSEFINGTFGYNERYYSFVIGQENTINEPPLVEEIANYIDTPYLFISTGSGGGDGYMYLNWIIATFGVPYELVIP
ncbi:hypothetical protein [Vulcanisaeta distributa]|uniref:Uncharacterized protein n=1 Tax=Vulcanisaeta distributa (strain DSM 14429 / JCM 11212 / NBRC 100878 / IC-017) TaxID=572478 RepID=E1QUW2_VULDI|nr:hypothetical protein [Vulcanisaeta distributa]ADN49965.1 conserved hypothetical protein [Vulcanisaeta distributa DSM 14429]